MLQLFAVGLSIVIADIWIRKEILEEQSFSYLLIISYPDFYKIFRTEIEV